MTQILDLDHATSPSHRERTAGTGALSIRRTAVAALGITALMSVGVFLGAIAFEYADGAAQFCRAEALELIGNLRTWFLTPQSW